MTVACRVHARSRYLLLLPCRRAGQVTTLPAVSLPTTVHRQSSLSAIHKGLRRSGTVGSQGSTTSRNDGRGLSRPLTPAERRRARAAAPKPTYRIRKGKKDITEMPGPHPKSRKQRFYDPDDPFGKKSLVYQLKTGKLRDQLRALQEQEGEKDAGRTETSDAWSSLERAVDKPLKSSKVHGDPTRRDRPMRSSRLRDVPRARNAPMRSSNTIDSPIRWDKSESSNHRDDPPLKQDRPTRPSRLHGASTGRDMSTRFSNSRHTSSRWEMVARSSNAWDGPQSRWDTESRGGRKPEQEARNTGQRAIPMSVPYTSAASQFLYGTSVVEAAIKAGRRKLYKLYVYGGTNRQNIDQDRHIEELARKKGIPKTTMGEDGLRLMNKLSSSRPHNGYVLEASPIPQLPVTGLGEVVDVESKHGFRVELEHQSAEDAMINGSSNFIPTPSRRNPLVVVLDQIRDPGNLGAVLRTASFFGVDAIAISKRNSVSLTPIALKASSGASETLTLFSIDSSASFLSESRRNGWQAYAAVPGAAGARRRRPMDPDQVAESNPLAERPCILMLGSEGDGLTPWLRNQADHEVSIPNLSGSDVVDSLNVSVAAGILFSAFLKRRSVSSFEENFKGTDGEAELW